MSVKSAWLDAGTYHTVWRSDAAVRVILADMDFDPDRVVRVRPMRRGRHRGYELTQDETCERRD